MTKPLFVYVCLNQTELQNVLRETGHFCFLVFSSSLQNPADVFNCFRILSHWFVSLNVAFFLGGYDVKKKNKKPLNSPIDVCRAWYLKKTSCTRLLGTSINDILQSSFCRSGFVPYSRTCASEWTICSSSREAFLPRIHCMDEDINETLKHNCRYDAFAVNPLSFSHTPQGGRRLQRTAPNYYWEGCGLHWWGHSENEELRHCLHCQVWI